MRTGRTALQVVRIVVLMALLRATGRYVNAIHQRQSRLEMGELWAPWAGVSVVCVLFVAVMLVGRRRWHPWLVLGVEAVVAAVLAFVPPLQWVLWFHLGGWATAMVGGFVQPLAVAWLGVVVLRGFHQFRDADGTSGPERSRGSAETSDGSDEAGRVITA